jgi:Enoyl-CoA hydratase/isomerase
MVLVLSFSSMRLTSLVLYAGHCLRRRASLQLLRKHLSATAAEHQGGIVSIALNNPRKRNALSSAVLTTLLEQLQAAKSEPTTKVVIISHWMMIPNTTESSVQDMT